MTAPAPMSTASPRQDVCPALRSPELTEAFAVFNETSRQLQHAYAQLERRVTVLTEELAQARSDRLAQLAETERLAQRLSDLLAALPGAVVVLDGAGRVQDHNAGATALFGEALHRRPWPELLRLIDAEAAHGGGELRLRDGRRLSVSVRPLASEDARILLLTDVTETRALQALLQRQERLSAMGEMMARLAHQARTPLAAAILYASQLRRAQPLGTVGVFTDRILGRLHHLENMLEDMLGFARGSDGGGEVISLQGLVDATLAELPSGAAQTIRLQLPAHGACVRGNRNALSGALSNLLQNALSYAQEGGVTLTVEAIEGDRLRFLVSDDGPGVDPHLRERIFEPFFTTRSHGTGLGLAVVRSVAEGHGGRTWVCVPRPGERGATFALELPCTSLEPDDAC